MLKRKGEEKKNMSEALQSVWEEREEIYLSSELMRKEERNRCEFPYYTGKSTPAGKRRRNGSGREANWQMHRKRDIESLLLDLEKRRGNITTVADSDLEGERRRKLATIACAGGGKKRRKKN